MTTLDINGNTVIRDVRSHGIPGLLGAPDGALIGGPKVRTVLVTEKRFPDLDARYVIERDTLTQLRARAAHARAVRKTLGQLNGSESTEGIPGKAA
jgi:hypothetical protein